MERNLNAYATLWLDLQDQLRLFKQGLARYPGAVEVDAGTIVLENV
jgi:hypothetical protein